MASVLYSPGPKPDDWCLPDWYHRVKAWDEAIGNIRIRSGCPYDADCVGEDWGCVPGTVRCAPELMRQRAEAEMRRLELWPTDEPLPLDVYTLARNIRSEYGSGTPMERAAIAWAARNRAAEEGVSITEHLLHSKTKRYGKQTGGDPPASTRQDPKAVDILLADAVLRGEIPDFTHGAVKYFDVSGLRYIGKDPIEVYKAWTRGPHMWVGHIPGIDPYRLFLFRRIPDELRNSVEGRHVLRQVWRKGAEAILRANRTPAPRLACTPFGWVPVAAGLLGAAVVVSYVVGRLYTGRTILPFKVG